MIHAPGEEWLSKQEPVLRGWLSKAILSFLAIGGPLLMILSEAPILLKLAGSAVWVLSMLVLWLLSWLAIYRTKVRSLEGDKAKISSSRTTETDPVSDLEHSLLDLMRGHYPDLYTREEIEALIELPRIEVDTALISLLQRKPPLVCKPRGGLWRDGQPHPNGWSLSTHGMIYTQKRGSEQAPRNGA